MTVKSFVAAAVLIGAAASPASAALLQGKVISAGYAFPLPNDPLANYGTHLINGVT